MQAVPAPPPRRAGDRPAKFLRDANGDRRELWAAAPPEGAPAAPRACPEGRPPPTTTSPPSPGVGKAPPPGSHLPQAAFFASRSGVSRFPGRARLLYLNGRRAPAEADALPARPEVYCEEADPLLAPIYRAGALRRLVDARGGSKALPPAPARRDPARPGLRPAGLPCRACAAALVLFCGTCGQVHGAETAKEAEPHRPVRIVAPPPRPASPPKVAASRRMVERWVSSLPAAPLRALSDDWEPPGPRKLICPLHARQPSELHT